MTTKTKLPPDWERCRTGIKGVRKWRNMATKCWVTDHADDPDTLHCGVRGVPSKRPRYLYTPEQAMICIDSECADHAETLSSPNIRDEPRAKRVGSGPWLGASGSSTTQDAEPTQQANDHP